MLADIASTLTKVYTWATNNLPLDHLSTVTPPKTSSMPVTTKNSSKIQPAVWRPNVLTPKHMTKSFLSAASCATRPGTCGKPSLPYTYSPINSCVYRVIRVSLPSTIILCTLPFPLVPQSVTAVGSSSAAASALLHSQLNPRWGWVPALL